MTRPVSDLQSGDAVIVLHRVLEAPRELVFEMFTRPEHLAQFWGPKAMRNAACAVDLRVGGAFRVEVQGPDGTVYPATGVYREIVPPERIVYAATTTDDNPCGAGLPPRSIVTISFADLGGKTSLTVHARLQSRADVEAAIDGGFNQGWTDSFDRLAELLASIPSSS
jgi:uncharacterized protein YndB with AHSA1/START domain